MPGTQRTDRHTYAFYLARAAGALVWVGICLVLRRSDSEAQLSASTVTLLAAFYASFDAAANAAYGRTLRGRQATLLRTAAAVSAVVALIDLTGDLSGHRLGMQAFGTWAIVSGGLLTVQGWVLHNVAAARVFLGISGVGSIAAGVSFLHTADNAVVPLIQYAVGGAVWYAAAALIGLAWNRRSPHVGRDSPIHDNPAQPADLSAPTPAV